MRVVLVYTNGLIPPENGGAKCHRLLFEALAVRGHDCEIVMPFYLGRHGSGQSLEALHTRGLRYQITAGDVTFWYNGVLYSGCLESEALPIYLEKTLRQRPAARVLFTEALGSLMRPLLQVALREAPHRVLFRAQTIHYLPFGPSSAAPDEELTALLKSAAGVFTQSHFAAEYLWRWAGMRAEVLRFPIYGEGPFSCSSEPSRDLITLINPCRLKGISILAGLAKRNPQLAFGAVPTWGTTPEDLALLASLPNITPLSKAEQIDTVFARTRILLAPTLGLELFGLVVVEAMLRGIPVLASDLGGLREAKLGVDYLLPARPLEWFRLRGSTNRVVPFVPPQELAPWEEALQALQEHDHYQSISLRSHEAAVAFVSSLSWDPFEAFFLAPR